MAPQRQTPHSRPRLVAVADRVEQSRRRARGPHRVADEVRTDVAVTTVVVGAACSVLGWWVAPVSRHADAAESWYALVLGTLFWTAACVAAIGLYLRLRRGLYAACVCALSFLTAVVIDAVLDSSVIGARWVLQLACAAVFCSTCAGAVLLNDRTPQEASWSWARRTAFPPHS